MKMRQRSRQTCSPTQVNVCGSGGQSSTFPNKPPTLTAEGAHSEDRVITLTPTSPKALANWPSVQLVLTLQFLLSLKCLR